MTDLEKINGLTAEASCLSNIDSSLRNAIRSSTEPSRKRLYESLLEKLSEAAELVDDDLRDYENIEQECYICSNTHTGVKAERLAAGWVQRSVKGTWGCPECRHTS